MDLMVFQPFYLKLVRMPNHSKPLYVLWRKSLDMGITPVDLKHSNIIPIHKGGSYAVPANYRPVALTSHIVKVFEKVIRKTLLNL